MNGKGSRKGAKPQRRAVSGFGEAIDDPGDAVLDESGAEVDQETEPPVRELDVGEKLLLVNRVGVLHGFQLDNNQALDQQVDAETEVEPESVVVDRDRDLTLYVQAPLLDFVREDRFVD